jgi:hypothetical protein
MNDDILQRFDKKIIRLERGKEDLLDQKVET